MIFTLQILNLFLNLEHMSNNIYSCVTINFATALPIKSVPVKM